MIDTILFDLDNTLVNRDGAVRVFCQRLVNRLRPDLDPQSRIELLQRIIEVDDHGYTRRPHWCREVSRLIGTARISPADTWQDFEQWIPKLITPSCNPERLQELSYRVVIAVLSNGSSAMQRAKLDAAGLTSVFSRVFISEEVGFSKPDRRIFMEAVQRIGCEPKRTMMVGDDPNRDIDPASEMGMFTCWITMGRQYPVTLRPPTQRVDQIDEFFDWFAVAYPGRVHESLDVK